MLSNQGCNQGYNQTGYVQGPQNYQFNSYQVKVSRVRRLGMSLIMISLINLFQLTLLIVHNMSHRTVI